MYRSSAADLWKCMGFFWGGGDVPVTIRGCYLTSTSGSKLYRILKLMANSTLSRNEESDGTIYGNRLDYVFMAGNI